MEQDNQIWGIPWAIVMLYSVHFTVGFAPTIHIFWMMTSRQSSSSIDGEGNPPNYSRLHRGIIPFQTWMTTIWPFIYNPYGCVGFEITLMTLTHTQKILLNENLYEYHIRLTLVSYKIKYHYSPDIQIITGMLRNFHKVYIWPLAQRSPENVEHAQ